MHKLSIGGVQAAIGTYEEALGYIGYAGERVRADVPLDLSVFYAHLGVLEDDNPVYWDESLSREIWGERLAPSSLLIALFTPLRWKPRPIEVGLLARTVVPLPGTSIINVGTEDCFFRPLRLGDWLSRQETVERISPEKKTALGTGHFVTTRMDYFDDGGEHIAEGRNTLFRFIPAADERANA